MTNAKAIETLVNLSADVAILGLQMPDGSYGVSVQQAASVLSVNQEHATRDVKRILGKGVQLTQVATNRAERQNRDETIITLEQFRTVLLYLDRAGNEPARRLTDILLGLSIEQLFHDAFGVHYEKHERQAYLAARYVHQTSFHPNLTSWLKLDGITKTYGTHINRFKLAAGLPLKPVQEYNSDELVALNSKEAIYATLRKVGFDHDKAIASL
jgi:hypothetical protein